MKRHYLVRAASPGVVTRLMDPSADESARTSPPDSNPPENPSLQTKHDPYAALRVANFRNYLLASLLSTIGGQIRSVAVGWDLYERTGSASSLGFVGLVQFLPVLLLTLAAGHAADRYSRKKLLVISQLLMGSASLGLAVTSWTAAPIIFPYLCLLLAGIGRAFSAPARWALLPDLAPKHLLASSVTWNTSGFQVASVVGPTLGGLAIAYTGGATAAFVLDVICSLLVFLLMIPVKVSTRSSLAEPPSLKSVLAGYHFVTRSKLILATITLDLFAVFLGGAITLLPIFAKDILHVGASGLGWLRAAPSLGAVVMALYLAHRPPMRKAGLALMWSVAGFGLATIIFGLSRNPTLSFLMLFLTGAFDNVSVVVRATLIQVLTPDNMRGRVSAVNAIFIGSSNELGGFESGMTAELFGPVASAVGGGVGTILVVLFVEWLWPDVRRLGELHRAGIVEETQPDEPQFISGSSGPANP